MAADQTIIDASLARGLRRFTAQEHQKFLFGQQGHSNSVPLSWEAGCRQMIRSMKSDFGPGNIHVFQFDKKVIRWLMVTHATNGFAVGVAFEEWKKPKPVNELDNFVPIILTAHFIERYIQSSKNDLPSLAEFMLLLWRATKKEMFLAYTGHNDIYPVWRVTGRFAFATPKLLALGLVPENNEMICKTIIRADRLEASKSRLWERARQTESGLLIK